MKLDIPEKVRLIMLIRSWRKRANLRHIDIINRLENQYNCKIGLNEFEHAFTTHPNRMAQFDYDLVFNLIRLFATLSDVQRCLPHEAVDVIKLTQLPQRYHAQLAQLFPLTEFKQAYSQQFDLDWFDVLPEPESPPAPDLLMPAPRRLFGIEKPLSQLHQLLSDPFEPYLILIVGLGGLGKTALAREVLRLVESSFQQVAWVTAKQQVFIPGGGLQPLNLPPLTPLKLVDDLLRQLCPQAPPLVSFSDKLVYLQKQLQQQACLVVIDNLETLNDYETLLPTLEKLTQPTKFLLTCREFVPYPTMFALPLEALNEADSFALLKHRAIVTNMPRLLDATSTELFTIYDTVGGNPLALELVVGQLNLFDLPEILANLREARGETLTLYRYIYQKSWSQLSEEAKQLLQGILFSPHCSLTQWRSGLANACSLDNDQLHFALGQLKRLSLIEVNTVNHNDYRYSLHRLTETFLITEVVNTLPTW